MIRKYTLRISSLTTTILSEVSCDWVPSKTCARRIPVVLEPTIPVSECRTHWSYVTKRLVNTLNDTTTSSCHTSLCTIIKSFYAVYSGLLTASLNKQQRDCPLLSPFYSPYMILTNSVNFFCALLQFEIRVTMSWWLLQCSRCSWL